MPLLNLSAYELTSDRLRLVPLNNDHLDGLDAINGDPEVMRYLRGARTRAETQNMIDLVQRRWVQLGYSWWAFLKLDSREIVGAGCIQNLSKVHGAPEQDLSCPLEIGWRVRRDRWRQGIAIEAATAMARFAFERLHADVLYAVCDPQNKASEGVMVKLGMTHRGLEDWYSQEVTTYLLSAEQWREGSSHYGPSSVLRLKRRHA